MYAVLSLPRQIISDSAHELYYRTLQELQSGELVASVQSPHSVGSNWGQKDRPSQELRYVTLCLQNPLARAFNTPHFPLEKLAPRTLLATISDETDLSALAFYDRKALVFSDDGKTLPTNYGHRAFNWNGINQVTQVIAQLREDPQTRRAVIHIQMPGDEKKRYHPCIDSLHFLIRNGTLNCHSLWRSENGFSLFPVNLFEFTMLQELVASELDIPVGEYVHTVTSLHYYLEDQSRIDLMLEELEAAPPPSPMLPMPKHSLEQVSILKELERGWRLENREKEEGNWEALSPYWQAIGTAIYDTANKRASRLSPLT